MAATRRKWGYLGAVTGLLVLTDQLTKYWAVNSLRPRPGGKLTVFSGLLDLSYVQNTGAAWGFLGGAPAWFRRPFFLVVSLAAVAFIVWIYRKIERGQWLLATALASVLGGAVGNFVDRAIHGYVIDFIDAHWFDGPHWPTFNVADIGISVGVVALFVEMFLGARRPREGEAEDGAATATPGNAAPIPPGAAAAAAGERAGGAAAPRGSESK